MTGTPRPTLPSTDTVTADAAASGSAIQALLIVIMIATFTGIVTVRMPSRSRR